MQKKKPLKDPLDWVQYQWSNYENLRSTPSLSKYYSERTFCWKRICFPSHSWSKATVASSVTDRKTYIWLFVNHHPYEYIPPWIGAQVVYIFKTTWIMVYTTKRRLLSEAYVHMFDQWNLSLPRDHMRQKGGKKTCLCGCQYRDHWGPFVLDQYMEPIDLQFPGNEVVAVPLHSGWHTISTDSSTSLWQTAFVLLLGVVSLWARIQRECSQGFTAVAPMRTKRTKQRRRTMGLPHRENIDISFTDSNSPLAWYSLWSSKCED